MSCENNCAGCDCQTTETSTGEIEPVAVEGCFASDQAISFRVADVDVLTLDAQGMTYKGARVEDAGAARSAFLVTMKALAKEQIDSAVFFGQTSVLHGLGLDPAKYLTEDGQLNVSKLREVLGLTYVFKAPISLSVDPAVTKDYQAQAVVDVVAKGTQATDWAVS